MPTPGANAIAAILGAKSYTVGGCATNFTEQSETVQRASRAMHAGWTSASPTTPTSMLLAFRAEFDNYLLGQGLGYIESVANGIDQETGAWVASWNVQTGKHVHVVSASNIVTLIMQASPVQGAGAVALAEAVASAFMAGFQQEVG